MSKIDEFDSACLCGSVKVTVKSIKLNFSTCHCETCRTWSGGPFFALECGKDVEITGTEKLKIYDSSPWAARGFCADCGTHLFYKLKGTGEYAMSLGLFPSLEGLKMDMQYFIDKRPSYYCFSNQTKSMTKKEIEEHFT